MSQNGEREFSKIMSESSFQLFIPRVLAKHMFDRKIKKTSGLKNVQIIHDQPKLFGELTFSQDVC